MPSYRTVFISHAHDDNLRSISIAEKLLARGINVWIDLTNAQVAHNLSSEINDELEQRTAFVLMVTAKSNASRWVQLERGAYVALQSNEATHSVDGVERLILPIRLSDEVPALLRGITWIDAIGMTDEQIAAKIADAVLIVPETDGQHIALAHPPISPREPTFAPPLIRALLQVFQPRRHTPSLDSREIAVIGYGESGSRFTVGICEQIGSLSREYAWLAGISVSRGASADKLQRGLLRSNGAGHYIVGDSRWTGSDIASSLVGELVSYSRWHVGKIILLWVVSGYDLQECLHALESLEATAMGRDIKLVILWLVPNILSSIDNKLADIASNLHSWARKTGGSMLVTTLVCEANSLFELSMLRQGDSLLQRGLASLLMGPTAIHGTDRKFSKVLKPLQDGYYSFAALATVSIGAEAATTTFKYHRADGGWGVGNPGDIDPKVASIRLEQAAEAMFDRSTLWTVRDDWVQKPSARNHTAFPDWYKQQLGIAVNLLAPAHLRATEPFLDDVCSWLQSEYSVNAKQVTLERLTESGDRGLHPNLSGPWFTFQGTHYLQLTAIRGVRGVVCDNGIPGIPWGRQT